MAHKCDGCRYKGEHQEVGFCPFGVCTKETNLVRAEQNYNAECCPYIVDVYAEGTSEELQNTLVDLTGKVETCQKVMGALQGSIQEAVEFMMPIVKEMWELIKSVSYMVERYPNRKVKHLALYHPKERVRKKNIHRIMRWIERGEPI